MKRSSGEWHLQKEIPGYCTLCRSRCGTLNVVDDGRLVEVRPNPSHPTGKAICPKGRAAPEIAHSARRLTTPLRRTRAKSDMDPGFEPISWDEALDEIAGKLHRFRDETGPQSVVFSMTSGSSSSISDSADWIQRLARAYGTPNLLSSTEVCNWHKDNAHVFTFGCATPAPDYKNAELIILWGHNPTNVWLAQAEVIGNARARGAKLVVIDPRRTALARDADLWLRVRPGTDAALALGLAYCLMRDEAYDKEFVHNWTNAPFLVCEKTGHFARGYDVGRADDDFLVWDALEGAPASATGHAGRAPLMGRFAVETDFGPTSLRTAFSYYHEAAARYQPEMVESITGIPASDVETFASMMAEAASVAYHGWTGIGQHTNATQTDRAIATLYALTGSFDRRGGNVELTSLPKASIHSMTMLTPEARKRALGLEERPLGPQAHGWINSTDFYDAVLEHKPYRVRALIGFGANLLVSHPASERGRAALEALDFQVHCDLFMNPTAGTADIVLPVASPWEFEALKIGFEISQEAQEHVQLRSAMIPPCGEARSDMWIAFQLAVHLGFTDLFFGGDIEKAFEYQLAPLGLDMNMLRENPQGVPLPLETRFQKYERNGGFATQTRKAEFYSELLHRHGYSPVPVFTEPAERLTPEHPLILFSVNNGYFRHSQDRGINTLRRRRREPIAEIHPDLAASRGIAENDWISIRTRLGEISARAKFDDMLARDVVASDYGWWQPAPDLGLGGSIPTKTLPVYGNFNQLISERDRDPVSGALALRSFACQIDRKIPGGWMGWKPFRVRERKDEAGDVAAISLEPLVPEPLPGFLAGQYLSIKVDGIERSYSLTNAALEELDHYSLGIRSVEGGALSPKIWNKARQGAIIEVRPPSGVFVLPTAPDFPVVLIAGGIGITPFLSYLETMAERPEIRQPLILHYACRSAAERPFRDRLTQLAQKLPTLRIILYLSQPQPGDDFDIHGRFDVSHIADELLAARARFYICASNAMIDTVERDLRDRGVPKFEFFKERFGASSAATVEGLAERKVTFAKSDRTIVWRPGTPLVPLLQTAQEQGLSIPSGCRVGQCESCSVRVLTGKIRHLIDLSELEADQCLTCQAVPLTDIVLDA
ncbi:2Fe-2S iron-sulfur cluster binding domain-containing protein [Agrobacterium tumefaciens]|uniref:2Fe-2S iron-sulfur cluster binding domain-containing protein n=2 Tax=Rhizobium/Agrobacterium group TaxID=227290 RepID=A0AAE6BDG4_AGRTU|nr:2Fe-2S iron-sulfur cluster binding domain-containing protein [Agrobacterium tumefaciens]QCL80377.1 2Fe-2S iron-sulfur cluster binding domain-containing protein [Agrobacterium tumefaciens]